MDKDPKLIVHTTEPFNAEPPVDELREHFITPQPLYYVRNHGEVPVIDENTFRLTVNGMVNKVLSLSIHELKNNFSRHTVMATLQCAGNRRNQLIEYAEVQQIKLDVEALHGIAIDKLDNIYLAGKDKVMIYDNEFNLKSDI